MIIIPEIFKTNNPIDDYLHTKIDIKSSIWREYLSHIKLIHQDYNLKKIDPNKKLDNIYTHHSILIILGRGRYQIRHGGLLNGAKLIGYAYKLNENKNDNLSAVIILEMVSFLGIIGNFEIARLLLPQISLISTNTYLLKISHYFFLVQDMRTGNLKDISHLNQSLDYFTKIKSNSYILYHQKILANYYRRKGNYKKANSIYTTAIENAKLKKLTHIQLALTHDNGLLHYYMKSNETAINILTELIKITTHIYTLAFIHSSLGFIYQKLNQLDNALIHFQNAFEKVIFNNIFQMEPGLCLYLGRIHKEKNNISLVQYYFERGFNSAQDLVKQNFPYNGDRLNAIESYIQFLKDYPNLIVSPLDNLDFSFAINKNLDEIRKIFHFHLITKLMSEFGSVRKSSKFIDLPERTFHHIKQRSINHNIPIPVYLIHYFITKNNTNWKNINIEFDRQILLFLTQYYGNKLNASNKLNISYAHFVKISKR